MIRYDIVGDLQKCWSGSHKGGEAPKSSESKGAKLQGLNISTISDLTPAKAAAILVGEMVTEVSNEVFKHGLLSELSHNFQTNLNGMERNKSNNFYSEL